MDKRILKSKKKIYDAFIKIRANKELRKITVKEICCEAGINKSTFYEYYEDIFDLSDKIETELVLSTFNNISNTDIIITNPGEFTKKLFCSLRSNKELSVVFSGSTQLHLIDKLSVLFKKIIFEKHPNLKTSPEFNIMLDYATFGGYYAYETNSKLTKIPDNDVIDIIVKIITHMYIIMIDKKA